jgi:hypothetical protein
VRRYNNWKHDPLAQGDPCNQIACRADLELVPDDFGGLDAKATNSTMVRARVEPAVVYLEGRHPCLCGRAQGQGAA